jgi:hypothetical protein
MNPDFLSGRGVLPRDADDCASGQHSASAVPNPVEAADPAASLARPSGKGCRPGNFGRAERQKLPNAVKAAGQFLPISGSA